jgi:hypothetical protein
MVYYCAVHSGSCHVCTCTLALECTSSGIAVTHATDTDVQRSDENIAYIMVYNGQLTTIQVVKKDSALETL